MALKKLRKLRNFYTWCVSQKSVQDVPTLVTSHSMSWLRCVAAVVAVDFSSVFPTFPIDDQFINERNFYKGLVIFYIAVRAGFTTPPVSFNYES
ncbi:hypothetical protein T08_16380 [Trichinella sp. T8]|nr:hypothetical protein T08_16380 [Trichinella sp. T8]